MSIVLCIFWEAWSEADGASDGILDKLLDLYRERKSPIHYSQLAEALQVNRFSAYDMLKALERKGLAMPQYVLRREGPGRSAVLFAPTPQAFSQLGETATRNGRRRKKPSSRA